MQHHLRAQQWSVGLAAASGLTATVLASATTWMVVTDPVAISQAVSAGDAGTLLRAIGAAALDMFRTLVAYL